jgi:hypothetical protein
VDPRERLVPQESREIVVWLETLVKMVDQAPCVDLLVSLEPRELRGIPVLPVLLVWLDHVALRERMVSMARLVLQVQLDPRETKVQPALVVLLVMLVLLA